MSTTKIACQSGITVFTRNEAGRVLRIDRADGSWTCWEYNSDDQRTSETDSAGNWRRWVYDTNGSLTSTSSSSGPPVKYGQQYTKLRC